MRAGAGKAPINLQDVLPFDGFDEVRHPICARALVIEADRRACIVSLEATSVSPVLMAALRNAAEQESGCLGPYVWICVTHAFSAPHVRTPEHLATEGEREKNRLLLAVYTDAVRQAVRQAAAALEPAEMAVAHGTCTVNVNRDVETPGGWWLGYNPEGFSDHELTALAFTRLPGEKDVPEADAPDGKTAPAGEKDDLIAVLFSADIQSSVLDRSRTSDGRRLVNGDLAGFAAGKLEAAHPGAAALFVVGAAADQAPAERAVTATVTADGVVTEQDAHEQGFRMLHQQGARLTQEVADALAGACPVPCATVRAERHPLTCPGQRRADFHALAPRRAYAFEPAESVTTTVSMLTLGPVVLAGVEPELPSALGHRIRTESAAAHTLVLTLVNGGAKYLPADDAYDKITYEAMNSGFARGSAEILTQDLLGSVERIVRKGAHMNVGCARRKITPQGPVYLIGYRDLPNRLEPATGIHDDIYANALLFQQGDREVFVFNADVLEFEEAMAEEVKTLLAEKYGIDRDCVLLSATHDHTSTAAYHRTWWTGKFDQAYYDWLLQTICDCLEECRANARPATAKMGKQVVTGFYDNRNVPGKLADNEVIVVSFIDERGTAFAGLVNWAVHSACVGPDCTELTSELAGLTGKKLAKTLGYYPAMIVGAAGDCSDKNFRQGRGVAEAERVSDGLAAAIAQIPVETEVPLDEIEIQTFYHTVAHDDFHLDLRCAVISLGGLHLFVFPSELGSDFGIQMKEACPVQGLVFGYTNGYFEYFLPAWEYGLSFETAHTQIPQGEPEKICAKFCQASRLLGAGRAARA